MPSEPVLKCFPQRVAIAAAWLGVFALCLMIKISPADELVPENECILELDLPEGATVQIDGKKYGVQRKINLKKDGRPLDYPRSLQISFQDGEKLERSLIVPFGNSLKIAERSPRQEKLRQLVQVAHNPIEYARWSHDGQYILTDAGIWQFSTGRIVRQRMNSFQGLDSFHPLGDMYTSSDRQGRLCIVGLRTGRTLRTFETQHRGRASFSNHGRFLMNGDYYYQELWKADNKQRVNLPGTPSAIAVNPHENLCVLCYENEKPSLLFNLDALQVVHSFPPANYASFSSDGSLLAITSRDSSRQELNKDVTTVWRMADKKKQTSFEGLLTFSRSSDLASVTENKELHFVDTKTWKRTRAFGHETVLDVEYLFSGDGKFSDDGSFYALMYCDQRLFVWDVRTGRYLRQLPQDETEGDMCAFGVDFDFRPNSSLLASGPPTVCESAFSGVAYVADVGTGQVISVFGGDGSPATMVPDESGSVFLSIGPSHALILTQRGVAHAGRQAPFQVLSLGDRRLDDPTLIGLDCGSFHIDNGVYVLNDKRIDRRLVVSSSHSRPPSVGTIAVSDHAFCIISEAGQATWWNDKNTSSVWQTKVADSQQIVVGANYDKSLVFIGEAKQLSVRNSQTGKLIQRISLPELQSNVEEISVLSHDFIAVRSAEQTLLFRLSRPKETWSFQSNLLWSSAGAKNTPRGGVSELNEIGRWAAERYGRDFGVFSVAPSTEGNICVWRELNDESTFLCQIAEKGVGLYGACIDDNKEFLLVTDGQGRSAIWNLDSGKRSADVEESIGFATKASDNRLIVHAGNLLGLLNWKTGEIERIIDGVGLDSSIVHKGHLYCFCEDQRIRAINLKTGAIDLTSGILEGFQPAIPFEIDQKYVIQPTNSEFQKWHLATGQHVGTYDIVNSSGAPDISVSGRMSLDWILDLSRTDGPPSFEWCDNALYDVSTGKKLLSAFVIEDNDWLVTTPEGFFDGSVSARTKICYGIGNSLNVLPVSNFFDGFYYPGLFEAILHGERPMPEVLVELPPKVRTLSPDSGSKTNATKASVKVDIQDQGGGIQEPFVKLNGTHYAVDEAPIRVGKKLQWRFTIPLVEGVDNVVEVHSATASGAIASEPGRVVIRCEKPKKRPELYMVAVGISDYADDGLDLKCARQDAEALATVFHSRGEVFYGAGKVHVTTVLDSQATHEGIQAAIQQVAANATPNDVFVLTISGHGVTLGQRYYFIPHEYQSGDRDWADYKVRRYGIAEDELEDWIAKLKATKRILVYDTCQSGGALSRNARNYEKTLEALARRSGCHVIAASASTQDAQELPDIGHGALTYALLGGLGAADRGSLKNLSAADKDGIVSAIDWFQFASEHVPEVTERSLGKKQLIQFKTQASDFAVLPVGK